MQRYTEKIRLRLTKEELEHLEKCFAKDKTVCFKDGKGNFSGFLRALILQNSNYKNINLQKQMKDMRYEIRKIGVNINQIAKKINSGFGTTRDLEEVKAELKELQMLVEKYQKEVKRAWESPS